MKSLNLLTTLVFVFSVAACNTINSQSPAVQTSPHSWIDAPLDGTTYLLNPSIQVTSHSSDPQHIVQVELSLNGQVVQTTPSTDTLQTLVLTKQMWAPPGPGNYTLMVRAQNSGGIWGDYAVAVITIQGAGSQPPPVAPPPIVVPSATPVTKAGAPTPSPLPAASITFYADATTLSPGQCTAIHWQATHVSHVALDGATVNLSGSMQDCPNQTTTHVLRVATLDGQNVVRTITLNVTPLNRTATPKPPTAPTATRTLPSPPTAPSATNTLPPPPPPLGCSGTPVISSFSASPRSISPGGSSTLSWGSVSNADSVEIDNGIGGVATPGSMNVSPRVTTIYVLTARCKGATAIARTIVTVVQPPTPTLALRRLPSPTPTRTPIVVR
jgi:hypothetical protein